MAVSIVGTPQSIVAGGTYTAEAGTNRLVVIAGMGESAFSSRPLVGLTLNVAMTEAAYSGNSAAPKGGVYFIKEADIAVGAMTLVEDWGGQTHETFRGVAYTLADVDQTTPLAASVGNNDGSGSLDALDLALTSVTDGAMIAAAGSFSQLMNLVISSTNTASTQTFTLDGADIGSGAHEAAAISTLVATGQSETVGLRWDTTGQLSGAVAAFAPASGGSSPTISNVDGDNAVNQYQLCNVNVANFTETVASATLNGAACVVAENDPSDDVVQVRMPGGLASGTYDFVLNGSGSETDTISGIAYTQTHPYTAPYGLVDSNSLFTDQILTANSYFRVVTGPTNGTLDAAGAESGSLWGNDIADIYTGDPGYTGNDTITLEMLYSDGTTDQWIVTIQVSDTSPPVVVDWIFGKGIKPKATQNWTWGKRHPMTNMRVRIYK